jgi:uncharacterized protein (DUF305 family)
MPIPAHRWGSPPALPVLFVFLAAACAPSTVTTRPAATPAEMAAAATADSVRKSYTEADVAFMSNMISHHAQAIAMAEMAPSRGVGSEVTILSKRIINAQRDEIATMQRWLRDRGLPVAEADPAGMKMEMADGQSHMMRMPGMLTPAQMKELEASRGVEFERKFLQYMIMHHKGAITMVDALFASHGAGQEDVVFKFASDVYADQSTEVARMQLMLVRRLGATDTN